MTVDGEWSVVESSMSSSASGAAVASLEALGQSMLQQSLAKVTLPSADWKTTHSSTVTSVVVVVVVVVV